MIKIAHQANTGSVTMFNKVPEVTLVFWIIKILSTTVGETAADFLAVDAGFGLKITSIVMAILLSIALAFQFRAQTCVPKIYWCAVVLVSILGTQLTDILTDKLDVSLYVSTATFAAMLALAFIAWYKVEGTLSIHKINTKRREIFYWFTILCTFALGTAAGDLATEALGMGFQWGTLMFSLTIAVTYLAYKLGVNSVLAFWIAYIMTRPLGAALGDLLSQSPEYGGLGLGAKMTSVLFFACILGLVWVAQKKSVTSLQTAVE